MRIDLSPDVTYVGVLFGLFVVPRILQRFRIPAAITSLGLGALAGPGLGLFSQDATISLLSTLGIVALFLFAGLDVDLDGLRRERKILGEHILVRALLLVLGGLVASQALFLETRPAVLVSLAVLTPSAGFILDSLPSWGLPERAVFWVRTKAVATELLALAAMFVILQSSTARGLALSTAVLVGLVLLLPVVFRGFARFIIPYAPKTEFAFLLMVAVMCALVTRQLGVYYLVGAFVVGMTAQRFRERLPALASEKMLHAVEAFASIFVPFYFFHTGLELRREDLSAAALLYGAFFLILGLPLRILLVAAHRKLRFGESLRDGLRVAVPLLPTLVFTLVIAEILRERFAAPPEIFGGLIVYALVNTAIPSLFFRAPPPEFETPEALPLSEPTGQAEMASR
jgi:Kef-type K+ transport system membrane component KefB